MANYPKVNYIGNKEKITDWIIEEFPIEKGVVLDLFAGGCSVSYALKKKGFSVIANDILYADYVIGKALIENDSVNLSKTVFNNDVDTKKVEEIKDKLSFLSNVLYYEDEVEELSKLIIKSESLRGYNKYLYLALLRRAMIRKLPYSRMNVPWNQIVKLRDENYSYAKYKRKRAYHNQSFESHMLENLDEYNRAVFSNAKCQVYNCDAIEIAKKIDIVDVVYMDPPYPSTMNNYDAFYGMFDNIFEKQKRHLDFTKKSVFIENMNKLIKIFVGKTKYIVLSQNTRVQPGPEEIKKMLSAYGKVEVKEKSHNYQVTGKDNKNASKELLFILKMEK